MSMGARLAAARAARAEEYATFMTWRDAHAVAQRVSDERRVMRLRLDLFHATRGWIQACRERIALEQTGALAAELRRVRHHTLRLCTQHAWRLAFGPAPRSTACCMLRVTFERQVWYGKCCCWLTQEIRLLCAATR